MRDERIEKELILSRNAVLIGVGIVAVLFVIFNILFANVKFNDYYTSIFIIIVVGITFLLRYTLYENFEDERISNEYGTLQKIVFHTLVYGGFFIHFLTIRVELILSVNISGLSSVLFIVAACIYIYQLRKRNVYAHYRMFNLDRKSYIKKKLLIALVYSFILSLNIVLYLNNMFLYGGLTILYTVSLIFPLYFIYALYERNHYDEYELFMEDKKRSLTKNAALLFALPMIHTIIGSIINTIFVYQTDFQGYVSEAQTAFSAMKFLQLYTLEISILSILSYVVIYSYIKKALPKLQSVLPIILTYIIIVVVYNIVNYINTTFMSVIYATYAFEFDTIIMIIEAIGTFTTIVMILSLLLRLFIGIKLTQANVPYMSLYWIFTVFSFVSYELHMYAYVNSSMFRYIVAILMGITSLVLLFIFFKKHDSKEVKFIEGNLYSDLDV